MRERHHFDGQQLLAQLREWAHGLGFSQIGVAGVDLSTAETGLAEWLQAGFHGSMDYMARHGMRRARPAELVPGTVSVITARMDYLARGAPPDWDERERDALQDLFRERALEKIYWALTLGGPNKSAGELRFPITESGGSARVSSTGKPSLTRYRVLARGPLASEVEETARA